MSTKSKSNEIKISRIYNFPVEMVWDAWVDPAQAAKWWGPRGFTLTTHSKELKPGGHWTYTMHGPDGKNWPNKTVYHAVEKHKLLIYDHGANDEQPALFRVTVTFKEIKGKTHMEMIMACPTAEEAEQTKKFIKSAGGNGTWDRLAEYLESKYSGEEIFVINRSFETSIETLFDMWIDQKHISQWMGPDGTTMEYIDSKIAEGSTTFYKMTYNTGVSLHGKIEYAKIQKPTYLEYVQYFCDKEGNISRHPMAPLWPEKMCTKIIFTKEDEGLTRITLTWQPIGKVTPEELRTFIEMRAGMTQGWTQSLDKLENYLS